MSAAPESRERAVPESAVWQDVEYGHYAADIPLWEELAAEAGGPVLELGAGSGRVSLALARRGVELIALERDPELCDELERRAGEEGLGVTVLRADVASMPALPSPAPQLALAPLHVFQQLRPRERAAALTALAGALPPGGLLAAALVDESSLGEGGGSSGDVPPDMRELDGWVYSSEPLWVQLDEDAMRVRRLRQRVSPAGEMERSVHDERLNRVTPEAFEAEASAAGFLSAGRRPIAAGPAEADSVAVLAEARG